MEVVAGVLTADVFKATQDIWLKGIEAHGDYRLSVGSGHYAQCCGCDIGDFWRHLTSQTWKQA